VSRGLVLLIGLQMRGWGRFLGRNLRTVRGAVTALIGGGFFALWLTAVLLSPGGGGARVDPDSLRRYGPAFLLFYCLMNVFVSTGERAIYFSPGEVNFLFAGPFGRREILAYKVILTFLVSIPSTLVFAAIVRVHATWFLAAYVALLLAILFQQLFGMAVNLLATSVGARAYSRGRRLLLGVLLTLVVVAVAQSGVIRQWPPRDLIESVAATSVWQAVATPLRWFFDAFLAERLWPDLLVNAGLALLVDLALLGVVFALDAHYLEAAASSSARIYSQIQRFRRGGMAAAGRGGNARFGVPDLPYLGGIGPVLWRQLTTAIRGMGRLAVVFGLIGAFVIFPLLSQGEKGEDSAAAPVLCVLVVWLTMFLTQMVPFDFRGDVDRIAALKALPLAAWRLALGQLLAPVVLVTVVQWATLAVAAALRPEDDRLLWALAAFAPSFNFLLFALENFLFLRFPTRVMAATPGDFQAVGRNLLFMLAKMAALAGVALGAAAVGVAAWLGTRLLLGAFASGYEDEEVQLIAFRAAALAGWLVVSLSGLALLPLVAWAFKAFDVGRDTPP
jgi:hypothetical protein